MASPVILIHGIAGSRLETHNKAQVEGGVTGGKLWLGKDMTPPPPEDNLKTDEQTQAASPPSNIVGLDAPVYDTKTDEITDPHQEHPFVTNWKKHLKLKDDDGITPEVETDPADKFNRFVDGINGISNLFLNYDDALGAALLKPEIRKVNYFLELVYALLKTDEYRGEAALLPANLVAAPYDWRIGPTGLEQRYQYFTNLKSTIEDLYKAKPLQGKFRATPVVIIAHSMGNRVMQYFLEWIKKDDRSAGQTWINQHIERYIAISPPWLGSPLTIRLLSTDDGFNLGGASLTGVKKVLQSFSSIPWLFPVTKDEYQYFNTTDFSLIRNEGIGESHAINEGDFRSETIEETLRLGGAESTTLEYVDNYYKNDPIFSQEEFGDKAVTAPPVEKIDVIYSTGFDTPIGAYYYLEQGGELKVASYLGNVKLKLPPLEDGDFIVKNGIRLETSDRTKQLIENNQTTNSGDGVVAYGSLAYFKTWQANPDVSNQTITPHPFAKPQLPESQELQDKGIDLSHNAIIRHPDVIAKIFSLLGI